MPPDQRDRIFDPFFSSKADLHGVGLGLFVAEGLVRSVGGRLTIGDAASGGARFVIELPVAVSEDQASFAARAHSPLEGQ